MSGQRLECERITFDGKVQHCESVSKEIKADIELFRKVHEELVENMDKALVFVLAARSAFAHGHFRMPLTSLFFSDMTTTLFHALTL